MKISFRSLYLKIFIWFWLAMIIINVVLFAAFALTRPTPTRRSLRDLAQTGPNAQRGRRDLRAIRTSCIASGASGNRKSFRCKCDFL